MRFVNATYTSLDGDISNLEAWHFDYIDDQATKAAEAQLYNSDALIMGRETYEGFAPAWMARAGEDHFSDRMNEITKYVVSSTMHDPEWQNTRVISGDVVAQVRQLKQSEGRDILQYGFGALTQLLIDNGLIDELRIWLHPVLSGKADPASELLYRDATQSRWTLKDVEAHENGLIILSYLPQSAS